MKKVVFMGTPDFAVPSLKKLIETQQVVGVVTQPDRPAGRGQQLRPSPVKIAAAEASIPVYQPKSLRSEEAAAPIRRWDPDVIIVAAFGQILKPHLLDMPPYGCINVHASLLPRWRGASPIQHAILAGDAQTGVTLMQMEIGLDTGPAFVSQAIPIHDDETAATLHDRLAELGAEMVGTHLNDILNGRFTATPQEESLVTYAPMINKEDGQLDWQHAAVALDRRLRAMSPWPGAFTSWRGKGLKIIQARPVAGRLPPGQPGQVVQFQETIVALAQEGGLELQQIQLAGKRAMTAVDFVRGRSDFVGSILGN